MDSSTEIELDDCCKQTLELIKTKSEVSEAAKQLTLATPLIQMLASLQPIQLAFTVGTTDFEGLATMATNIGSITKMAILRDIDLEIVSHDDNRELKKFWKNFRKSFE